MIPWLVLTGAPTMAKMWTVTDMLKTATKAVKASSFMIPVPTFIMTRLL